MKIARPVVWLGIALSSVFLLAACVTSTTTSSKQDGDATFVTGSEKADSQKRARIRLQLASEYYQQGQMNVALDEVKLAIQMEPGLSDAYSMAGLIYMDLGETQLAEENLKRAISLAPNDPDLSNNYGWFLCQNGRASQSIPYFEAAIANKSYLSPAKALNNAGVCSLILKNPVAADKYFNQAFRYDPSNPTTNTNLARINYERGDFERAQFYIFRVTKQNVMSAEVLWLAVKIERKMGDRASEASFVNQLRRRYPNSHEFAAYQRGAFNE